MERDDGHAVGSEGQVQGRARFHATSQTLNAAVSAIDGANRCSNYVRLLYYRNPSAIALGNIIAPREA